MFSYWQFIHVYTNCIDFLKLALAPKGYSLQRSKNLDIQ